MPDILSKRDGAVLEITLNRPEHGNGATDEMAAELTRLIREAGDGTQVILLRGAGADFCIGRHLLGSQVYDYWADPYGRVHEHWADSDRLNVKNGSNLMPVEQGFQSQWGEGPPEKFIHHLSP